MNEWVEGKFSDVAEVIMGQSPVGSMCNNKGIGIPLLNGPTEFTSKFPLPVQFTTDARKLSKDGDLLFCVRGSTTGKMNWSNQVFAIGRGLAAIRHKKSEKANPFIKAVLVHSLDEILAGSTGSTFPNVSRTDLENLKISLPPLPEQQAIAEVLSSIDDKIDLLHRNNKTLEEMAETLFRQWFLDTEFNSTINDVAEVLNGYAFKSSEFSSEGKNYVIKIKNIGGSSVNISDCDRISDNTANKTNNKFKVLTGDVLFAMTGAELGKMGIVGSTTRSLWLNQRVGSIKDRFNGSRYLAYLALNSELGQDFILNTASGSAQPNISGVDISRCPFPSISPEQIEEKSEVLNNLFDKVIHNLGQISILKETRDTLLPKLMSGQVVVN